MPDAPVSAPPAARPSVPRIRVPRLRNLAALGLGLLPAYASTAALALTWLATSGALVVMLLLGVRGTGHFAIARIGLHVGYVVALAWYLVRRGPSLTQPPGSPLGAAWTGYAGRLAAAGLAVILLAVGLADVGLFMLLLAAAALVVLASWRRQITLRAAVFGVAASTLAFLSGGIAFWRHGFVGRPMLLFMLVAVPPMFMAGGMLVARTGVGAVRVLEGRYDAAARSFARGALLCLPLGLANAAGPARQGLDWVSQWWQPLALPMWSGIVEETLFRAFLICLLFALLRPAFKHSPHVILAVAVLFSAVTFGLGHGQSLGNLLGAGLGYGLPMAVIFSRRDWEHAVGAHYAINMVPWLMTFLAQ